MAEQNRQAMQQAAQHLLQNPLTCIEHNSEIFASIRRHEQALDRWFTQRLGYRLQTSSTTARLFKSTVVPHRPRLAAPVSNKRRLSQRECTLLALILSAVAAGPRVISLRDLISDVRSRATEANITLNNEAIERRAFVIALKWMLKNGLATELHQTVDSYEHDDNADAILEIDFDRVSLLPLAALGRANTTEELLDRSDRRTATRQWMRARLTEDPVLYRTDLNEMEWSELRRRVGDEVTMLEEMFGLRLEVRSEGLAAIDARGQLSDQTFPTTGTVGHAALKLVEWMLKRPQQSSSRDEALQAMESFSNLHNRHWSKNKTENPAGLLAEALSLLIDLRLLHAKDNNLQLLPAAARYKLSTTIEDSQNMQSASTPDHLQRNLFGEQGN